MEKDIQERAAGELDWEKADWAWARTNLLVQFHSATTIAEKTAMRRKFREEAQKFNQLVSNAELKIQLDVTMLRKALEWRRDLQREKNSRAGKDESSVGITSLTPSHTGIREAPEVKLTSDQMMIAEFKRDLIRVEYSNSLLREERYEMKAQVRNEHPGASEEEIKAFYSDRLLDKALEAQAKKKQDEKDLSEV